MEGVILVIAIILLFVNVGAMIWMTLLQNKVVQRDDDVARAQHELDQLRQQASNITLARLILDAQDNMGSMGADLRGVVEGMTTEFKNDLNETLARINAQSTADVNQVIAAYRESLEELRGSATSQMQAATAQLVADFQKTLTALNEAANKPIQEMTEMVDEHKAGLEARVKEEVKKHELKLIAKFDAKVSDVVSNYLTETLGNDVDLGAQGPYLFRMLEEHKDDLKKEIVNGA